MGCAAYFACMHACMLRGMLCLLSLSLVLQVGWCGALVAAGCLKPCCQQQLCGYLHSSTWLCLAQEHAGWVWQFLRVVSRCQMGAHATMACAHALTRSQARPIVDESIIYYQLAFVAWTAVIGVCWQLLLNVLMPALQQTLFDSRSHHLLRLHLRHVS